MGWRIRKDGRFDQRYNNKELGHTDAIQKKKWARLVLLNIISFLICNAVFSPDGIIPFLVILLITFTRFALIEYKRGALEKLWFYLYLIVFLLPGLLILLSLVFPEIFQSNSQPQPPPGEIWY